MQSTPGCIFYLVPSLNLAKRHRPPKSNRPKLNFEWLAQVQRLCDSQSIRTKSVY